MIEIECRSISADQTLPLRKAVLWPNLPLEKLRVHGDENAHHVGAFLADDLVGVASFFEDGSSARLRKFAVAKAMQGQGTGSKLLAHGIDVLKSKGFQTLWCDARVSATSFYKRHGFDIDTAIFHKSGEPYVKATLRLDAN